MSYDSEYDSEHAITVNNVQLPIQVVRELQRLGRALEWYTQGELSSAVVACAIDGNLIDDPDGIDFMDRLELTPQEAKKQQSAKRKQCYNSEENEDEDEDDDECCKRNHLAISEKIISFCKRLKDERLRRNIFCCG